VRPVPSIPWVTSSAVERAENPDGPFQPKIHIFCRDKIPNKTIIYTFYTAKTQHRIRLL